MARARSIYLQAFGERKTIWEWLKDPRCKAGSFQAIYSRLRSGWANEDAIVIPRRPYRSKQ